MTRICWWLVDKMSRLLEPDERNAVLGDFAETGEAAGQALRDVLGLVARRQAGLWTDWRPWMTLVGLIVPLGMLLSIVSRTTADKTAIYIWMYAHWWGWAFLGNPGFRADFAHYAAVIFVEYTTLVCWSWTSGFVLGSASRRIVQVNGVLFCLMLLLGAVLGAPEYLSYYRHSLHAAFHFRPLPDPNAAVFAGTFYRVLFPLIVQAVLVVVPSLWGIRQGLRVAGWRPPLRTIVWAAAIASLAALVIQEPGFVLFVEGYRRPGFGMPGLMRLLPFIVYWPVGYGVAYVIKRGWSGTMASI